MHPAARVLLGILALWTLFKTPLFFVAAERIRRHLHDAPEGVRRTLRNRMIGSYGAGVMNAMTLLSTAGIAITGTTAFIEDFTAVLITVLAIGAVTGAIGVKAVFDSLHNPQVHEFEQRYGIESSSLFRRDRRAQRPTAGG